MAALKFTAIGIAFWVLVEAAAVGLSFATLNGAIPPSCRQPSTVDYSNAPTPAYGRYSVKFTSQFKLPWGTTSSALVGHDQSADGLVDYGFGVDVESTDIGAFRCRWTDKGVTIIEPPGTGVQGPQVEHFVPAEQFLGGR